MSESNVDYLDLVVGIKINRDTFPLHNLHALDYLPHGLYELAMPVRQKEIREINDCLMRGEPIPTSVFMPGHYGRLVASLFNWFSLSLCNYLRLIALVDIVSECEWDLQQIRQNRTEVKRHCAEYTQRVAPEVKLWRDKVAAHPALTDPQQDNLAMLQYSVFDSFMFTDKRFVAGSMRYIFENQDPPVLPWSLTEVYERLAPRYWNQMTLPSLPEG